MELSPRSAAAMLEPDCPCPLELKSAPGKKMWIKLRSLEGDEWVTVNPCSTFTSRGAAIQEPPQSVDS